MSGVPQGADVKVRGFREPGQLRCPKAADAALSCTAQPAPSLLLPFLGLNFFFFMLFLQSRREILEKNIFENRLLTLKRAFGDLTHLFLCSEHPACERATVKRSKFCFSQSTAEQGAELGLFQAFPCVKV